MSCSKSSGGTPAAGMRLPLTKNAGVPLAPSDVPTDASAFTAGITFGYCASKSVIPATSAATRRIVAGLNSSWWRKNQSFSFSARPFGFAMRNAPEASQDAAKLTLGTGGLQFELIGPAFKTKLPSFQHSAHTFAQIRLAPTT